MGISLGQSKGKGHAPTGMGKHEKPGKNPHVQIGGKSA